MMECTDARRLIPAKIDGELDATGDAALAAHLEGCAACARLVAEQQEWRGVIKSRAPRFAAPAALRARLAVALREADRPATPATRRYTAGWRPMAMAASVVLAVVLSSSLTGYLTRPGDDDRLVQELVSDHVRSLMADHLTDVASSDQHTVKPWFHGRLDLAPPVIDLTAQGFTLIGGRLDFIDGKPVAAIVYRRRVHVINLFVAQGLGSVLPAPRLENVQGFNIRRWTDQGLNLLAVSDINRDELEEFGAKFEAAARATGAG